MIAEIETTKAVSHHAGTPVKTTVHAILPAFNEEDSLPNLLKRFAAMKANHPEFNLIIRVVDDGSSDRTAEIAQEGCEGIDVRLVTHEKNAGLGQAMLTGIEYSISRCEYDDVIIAMDADDTHDVNLIPKMLEEIDSGADIAIASRFVEGGDDTSAPPFRRLLSRGASVVFKSVFPLDKINDFTSGYRMYRASLLKHAYAHWGDRLIEEEGFACMVELLLKLRYWEPEMREVGMFLQYDRKLSASKLKLFKTLRQYLKLAFRNALTPAPRKLKYEKAMQ
ncbi:MAG: glycosyltransferase family 2 protein [Verrucomicrobiales bacterium]|nr:glycosyltransferase family 2 protein [Verrucomicrobiales bacterium]